MMWFSRCSGSSTKQALDSNCVTAVNFGWLDLKQHRWGCFEKLFPFLSALGFRKCSSSIVNRWWKKKAIIMWKQLPSSLDICMDACDLELWVYSLCHPHLSWSCDGNWWHPQRQWQYWCCSDELPRCPRPHPSASWSHLCQTHSFNL